MDPAIKELLANNRVEGRHFTHVSQGARKGKYQLNRRMMDEFFDQYTEQAIEMGDKNIIEIGISEQTQLHMPVLVDLDIKLKEEDDSEYGDPVYTYDQVEKLVTVYQVVLSEIVENCKEDDLTCVLLEKPAYRTTRGSSTYYKNGFHLHFPYIFLKKKDQKVYLLPRVKEKVREQGLFDNLVEDSGALIDEGYLSNPWLVYGSSKGEKLQPYKITKIYDSDCEEIYLEDAFRHYELYDSQDKLIKIGKNNVEKNIVRIMSTLPLGRPPKNIVMSAVSPSKSKKREERTKMVTSVDARRALEISKRLIPMINEERVDDHNDWMTVGWSLFNCTDGCMEGFDLWCQFTQRSPEPRGEARCAYEWGIMKRNCYNYTLGTLHYLAKMDSPEKYKEYKNELAEQYMEHSIEGSHTDIARLLKNEYVNDFVCASIENKIWYRYEEPIWERMDSATYLRKKIPELEHMYKEVEKKAHVELMQAIDDGRETDKAKYQKKIDLVQKLKKNVKSTPFINNVITESAHEFFDPRFKDKLDVNPYLIAFKNGVYDPGEEHIPEGQAGGLPI